MNDASPRTRAGLYVLGLLSLFDVAGPLLTDGDDPPYAVAFLGSVLGLVSLVLIYRALRNPAGPVRLLIGLRVLSAVTALPAFVVSDVPGFVRALAFVFVVATAVGIALIGTARTSAVTS